MHIISRSFRAQRSVAMNPRQLALFLGFYFYVLNVNAANDAQRIPGKDHSPRFPRKNTGALSPTSFV